MKQHFSWLLQAEQLVRMSNQNFFHASKNWFHWQDDLNVGKSKTNDGLKAIWNSYRWQWWSWVICTQKNHGKSHQKKQTCKAKIGFKMLHNRLAMCSPSFATMLMSATLDRLSIPASMKGLSNSRSSSLAIASFNRNMWKPDAANNEALSKIAVQQKLLLT